MPCINYFSVMYLIIVICTCIFFVANGTEECGVQGISLKILNGELTAIDEFPWIALMIYRSENSTSETIGCSGNLLNSLYVITAAHCIKQFEKRNLQLHSIRLGEYNVTTERDCIEMLGFQDCADPPQDISVEKYVVHPLFNKHFHDVALVKLKWKAQFSDFVQPICLPSSSNEEQVGDKLIVSGWGRTETGFSSSVKLKVSLPLIPFVNCYELYKKENIILNETQHLCVGGINGSDSCAGDSGGPLMTSRGNGRWKLIGITSLGKSCGLHNWPAIYIRVRNYLDWINENIKL